MCTEEIEEMLFREIFRLDKELSELQLEHAILKKELLFYHNIAKDKIKSQRVYKIRHKKTGLYRTTIGGWSSSQVGRVWLSKTALKLTLIRLVHKEMEFGSTLFDFENWVVKEFALVPSHFFVKDAMVGTVNVEDFYDLLAEVK